MIQTASAHFDWILIDSPPVIALTDALLLAKHADASLMVIREGGTPRETVAEALDLLGRERVLGVVFNGARGLNRRYSKYGYY